MGSSCSLETTRFLMLRTISTTSSLTPGTVSNSCWLPSRRMLVTAAPGMDESSVRRSELPSVYPNPGSRGSMTNAERNSEMTSSQRVGRCAMSTWFPFGEGVRHMTPTTDAAGGWAAVLVELWKNATHPGDRSAGAPGHPDDEVRLDDA